MKTDELKTLKKDELIQLVIKLQKELAALKGRMSGKIGSAAGFGTKNPYVK